MDLRTTTRAFLDNKSEVPEPWSEAPEAPRWVRSQLPRSPSRKVTVGMQGRKAMLRATSQAGPRGQCLLLDCLALLHCINYFKIPRMSFCTV